MLLYYVNEYRAILVFRYALNRLIYIYHNGHNQEASTRVQSYMLSQTVQLCAVLMICWHNITTAFDKAIQNQQLKNVVYY